MSYHLFADDSQIYQTAELNHLPDLIESTEQCLFEIKNWMDSYKLKLNENKTEVML